MTDNNKYIECGPDGKTYLVDDLIVGGNVSTKNLFYVYGTPSGFGCGTTPTYSCIAFKNQATNKWLVAEPNGDINCDSDEAGPWEKWYGWK